MNIYIENDYEGVIDFDYKKIIKSVVNEAADFVSCPYECEVNITIVNDIIIKEINRELRKIDKPTDVLSFPLLEYETAGDFEKFDADDTCFHPDTGELMLGDIIISYDKVISQSLEYNHSMIRELAFLTAHSMLHLFGYDHMTPDEAKVMEAEQEQILNNISITRE